MNGVHDMGGMHGLGPIAPDPDEPLFHAPWEARVLALTLALGRWGRWNIDASRHQRELIPGPDYLRMSYYEKWFAGLVAVATNAGLITRAEVDSGRPDPGAAKLTPPLTADGVPAMLAGGGPASRPSERVAQYAVGDQVRVRNFNPISHTRAPRYTRGRLGIIQRLHGAHVFPDSNAHFQGENPQPLYTVAFTARELWGEDASPRDRVYADLWEDYLDAA